jgi:hypothetical protein
VVTASAGAPRRRGLAGGLGVPRPAGKSRGSGGGCAGQQERRWLSLRHPGVGEGEKVLQAAAFSPAAVLW